MVPNARDFMGGVKHGWIQEGLLSLKYMYANKKLVM